MFHPDLLVSGNRYFYYLESIQTYYDEISGKTGKPIIRVYPKGNSVNMINFIEILRKIHPVQKIILIWNGAMYHDIQELRNDLNDANDDKDEHKWAIYYIKLALYAPEQDPIEALGLHVKNFLRQVWHLGITFKTLKWLFQWFLEHFVLHSAQLKMYGSFS